MNIPIKFQIGKLGLTSGVIDSLLLAFKNHKVVRISLLKAAGRDRESKLQVANDISKMLSQKSQYTFTYNIIGFTIILRRHAKP